MILRYRPYVWYMCVIKYFIRRAITLLYFILLLFQLAPKLAFKSLKSPTIEIVAV